MKIAIIGAGSTYTPELIEGIIQRAQQLEISKISLMDIDERKLTIVGSLAKRMIDSAGVRCETTLTMELDDALTGADFVLTQIRVGKLPCRVLDEKIPLKYNLLGQETMGIGGFFKGLRTIPVILNIASRMEKLCPDAFMINFANPAGMVSEAVLNRTGIKMMGLCNVPFNMKKSITEKLSLTKPDFEYIGLNHLSWVTGIREGGVDYIKTAVSEGLNSENMKNIPKADFPADLIGAAGGIPSPYLGYVYFLSSKIKLAAEAKQSRGERCMEIEDELLKLYEDTRLHEKPKLLESRGGANYSLVAISLVDAIYNDKQEVHIVNTKNNGAVAFMGNDDVIEISCRIGKNGATPIPIPDFCNAHIISTMKQFKTYEKLAVEAAVSGNVQTAIEAMLSNPLIYDYKLFKPCFDELLEAHREFLPNFN